MKLKANDYSPGDYSRTDKRSQKKIPSIEIPVIDLGCCILCEICAEIAPHAFQINDAGFVEILTLDDYSDEDIHEAVKNCPKGCISFEQKIQS